MSKVLRALKRVFIVIVCCIIIAAVIIFFLRWMNGKAAQEASTVNSEIQASERFKLSRSSDPLTCPIKDMSIEPISHDTTVGYLLTPREITHKTIIVTYGGSEGSSNLWEAYDLAQQGYKVYSLYFYGTHDLPAELEKIPLENFQAQLSWIKAKENGVPLTVVAGSKGSEYALLGASTYPDLVKNLVLFAPTAYSFQGLSQSQQSNARNAAPSFTYEGSEVPYIPFMSADPKAVGGMLFNMAIGNPVSYCAVYNSAIDGAQDLERSRIKSEKFPGNLLLIAGEDDHVWPSVRMAKTIKEHNPQAHLEIMQQAGHIFMGPTVSSGLDLGGSREANLEALRQSDEIVHDLLNSWDKE